MLDPSGHNSCFQFLCHQPTPNDGKEFWDGDSELALGLQPHELRRQLLAEDTTSSSFLPPSRPNMTPSARNLIHPNLGQPMWEMVAMLALWAGQRRALGLAPWPTVDHTGLWGMNPGNDVPACRSLNQWLIIRLNQSTPVQKNPELPRLIHEHADLEGSGLDASPKRRPPRQHREFLTPDL